MRKMFSLNSKLKTLFVFFKMKYFFILTIIPKNFFSLFIKIKQILCIKKNIIKKIYNFNTINQTKHLGLNFSIS